MLSLGGRVAAASGKLAPLGVRFGRLRFNPRVSRTFSREAFENGSFSAVSSEASLRARVEASVSAFFQIYKIFALQLLPAKLVTVSPRLASLFWPLSSPRFRSSWVILRASWISLASHRGLRGFSWAYIGSLVGGIAGFLALSWLPFLCYWGSLGFV